MVIRWIRVMCRKPVSGPYNTELILPKNFL